MNELQRVISFLSQTKMSILCEGYSQCLLSWRLYAHYSMCGGGGGGHEEENSVILNLNNRFLLLFYFPGKLW